MKRFSILALVLVLTLSLGILLNACNSYNYFEVPTTAYRPGEEFLKGWSNDNNGYAINDAEVQRLINVVPSERQLNYLELEYYCFIHFGMNTFTGKEWGTGKESPQKFNPTDLSTDQWCEVIKASGAKGVILTAKHHDGFCLWPTATTEHSVKNSPYKNGNGDILAELSESCRRFGLKMGIYLSPWDMNAESYGTDAYHDFYMAQLTELLDGRYGVDTDGDGKKEIFCVWMDGALGEEENLDNSYYKMDEYEALIRRLQPDCVTAIQGSDVRWVGNEAGIARPSEWSVVGSGMSGDDNFQTDQGEADDLQAVNPESQDLGSREVLKGQQNLIFKPAEVDVSIRKGWFYHPLQQPKDVEHLLQIYYTSVGGNSSLLLNIPPNKEGRIAMKDVRTLIAFGNAVRNSTANPVAIDHVKVGNGQQTVASVAAKSALLDRDGDEDGNGMIDWAHDITSYWMGDNEYIIDLDLQGLSRIGRIDLREDLRYSQRIEAFEIWIKSNGGWKLVGDGTVVGNRKIMMFDNLPATDGVRIVIKQSRSNPVLRSVAVYEQSQLPY